MWDNCRVRADPGRRANRGTMRLCGFPSCAIRPVHPRLPGDHSESAWTSKPPHVMMRDGCVACPVGDFIVPRPILKFANHCDTDGCGIEVLKTSQAVLNVCESCR